MTISENAQIISQMDFKFDYVTFERDKMYIIILWLFRIERKR
jgi:hypothetical protein